MNWLLLMAIAAVATFFGVRYYRPQVHIIVGGLAAMTALTFAYSLLIVDTGQVAVRKIFGETMPGGYTQGIHFINPVATVTTYETRRRDFEMTSGGQNGGEIVAITADDNPLTLDVGFATSLNSNLAWKMQTLVGEDYFRTLVMRSARTAVRDGIAQFRWNEAAGGKRAEAALAVQQAFEKILYGQLLRAGFSDPEAQSAITVFPVQLRKVLPDARVLNAIAEKTASEQDLERQETLTRIAEEEAKRRANEGLGVSKLFQELPKEFTPEQISDVLRALANKARADAMLKAVESSQVDTIIMNGDGGAVPAISAR